MARYQVSGFSVGMVHFFFLKPELRNLEPRYLMNHNVLDPTKYVRFLSRKAGLQTKILPPDQGAAPGQSASEDRETDQIVFLNAPIPDRLVQGNGA